MPKIASCTQVGEVSHDRVARTAAGHRQADADIRHHRRSPCENVQVQAIDSDSLPNRRGSVTHCHRPLVLRTRTTITYRFSISSSGRLWPFLNRENSGFLVTKLAALAA